MFEDFLVNLPMHKIFHNKSTKTIKRKKIVEHIRKCHSYKNNDEKFEEKLNILNKNAPLSESISIISYSKEDLKDKEVKNQTCNSSVNLRKNSYKYESTFGEGDPEIKKICSSNIVNCPKKLENFRKQFLEENKDDDSKKNKNDEAKIKRPNYLIKSCFYNNSEINQTKYMRSYSRKECSPVLNFFGYKENNDSNGFFVKKYYKQSTFGKVNNNNINNNNETISKKNINETNIDYDNLKFELNNNMSINNNNNYFLKDNEESFIKIIQADSSDDEKKVIKQFLGENNDFENEIDKINKIKDKEDTLSNLVNISFKSQKFEKRHSLNESMNNKHNNSIHFSAQNLSEGLSNSNYSNRSLNEEFVFRNHSKIFKKRNNNDGLSTNNSMNKFQEDKINFEANNLNKSDRHNLLNYLKNNDNQKDNIDSEEEFDNKQNNNINNNTNNNVDNNINNNTNNNINIPQENNQFIDINPMNNKINNLNQNNLKNNKNNIIYDNPSNNINNNLYNQNVNQFFPQTNNNNINNNNYLQNLNYLNYRQNNNMMNIPNPYINNTINFIYNNNMNLFYNNPYNINNNELNQPNINNNNFPLKNNNLNYNYYPQEFSNSYNNSINQMIINNNILNNANNFNNINNGFYQNNNILNYNNVNTINNMNQNIIQKQQKNINKNKSYEKLKDLSKMTNEELARNAHILAKSQEGSRYLEKIIDSNPSLVSNLFFPYTLGYFEELSNNKYGNFYIKKLIKHLTKDLFGKLIEFLFPMITRIGTNQYGSKILEQLIKSIKDDDKLLLSLIQIIIPHLILLINDLNGTHIIYKLLLLKSKYIRLIEENICNNIKNIYITREGSNLLKKYFDIINKECNNTKNYDKIIYFINTINNNLSMIITDQFGNYIIRHIILNLNHSINSIILQNITNNLVYYSNQKYSSNVVENCLDNNYIKDYILNELTKQYTFNSIFLNEYGNYVIQKAISLSDEEKRDIFFKFIIQVTRQLQTMPFGQKLLSKLLMTYPKLSMYLLSIYK